MNTVELYLRLLLLIVDLQHFQLSQLSFNYGQVIWWFHLQLLDSDPWNMHKFLWIVKNGYWENAAKTFEDLDLLEHWNWRDHKLNLLTVLDFSHALVHLKLVLLWYTVF